MRQWRMAAGVVILWGVLLLAACPEGSEQVYREGLNQPATAQAANVDPATFTVYVTKTGEKYHLESCKYLAKSRQSISLKDAKAQGYKPCTVCNPPK